MKITKTRLKQLIKEELKSIFEYQVSGREVEVKDQWTPLELKAVLDRGLVPIKAPGLEISDDVWQTSISRCAAGEGEYCPLNYGTAAKVGYEPGVLTKDFPGMDPKLKKPLKIKKRKKRDKDKEYWDAKIEQFNEASPECDWCALNKAVGILHRGGEDPYNFIRQLGNIRRAAARAISPSRRRISLEQLFDMVEYGKYLELLTPETRTTTIKRYILQLAAVWRTLTSEQRKFLKEFVYARHAN